MIDNDNYNEIRRDMNDKYEPWRTGGDMKFDPKSRYYDQGGIEVQEIIRAKLTPEQYEGFCLGNIIKYSARANWKGKFHRDVEKVGFYQKFLDEAYTDRMNKREPVPATLSPLTVPSGYCETPEDGFWGGGT